MKKAIVALLLLAFVGVFVAALDVMNNLHTPYKGYAEAERFVQIPPRASAADIRKRLVDAGIIRDGLTLRFALRWTGASRDLKAGEYRFDRPMSPIEVVEKIARGDVYARRITFPEGLTIRDMAGVYESQRLGRSKDFLDAAQNVALIQDLDPQARDLEGYLFPDTYTIARSTPAARLVEMMVSGFRLAYTPELQQKAREQELSTRDVVTLASLVEKETGKTEERPLVAAVYRNRLKIGMGMQADPTVVYALQKAGKYDGNIRREDLSLDSPYNTYRHAGLPPGPIAAPGKGALEAALQPAAVDYLYFVSRNDGSHVFAKTLEEHNRNVREFQVLYFQRQRR